MKNKIVYIFLITLLIIVVFPVSGTINNNKISSNVSVMHDYSTKQTIDEEWSEMAKLTASDGTVEDLFGYSVSIDGDYAIIAADGDDSGTGSAYIFKRSGTTWIQEDKLTASDASPGDFFGVSVSIDGDYAIVGAIGDDSDTGSAYFFKRSGTTWIQEDKLTASDGTAEDLFGCSVSIDGNFTIIGARGDRFSTGSAYIFVKNKPPNPPTIDGPTSGKLREELCWNISSVDPDNDDIMYIIDWDDGDSETTGFNPSGVDVKVKHTWQSKGTYTIRAYAEDEFGLVGPEGTFTVTITKGKSRVINTPFQWFLQQHPNLFPILRLLFQRY